MLMKTALDLSVLALKCKICTVIHNLEYALLFLFSKHLGCSLCTAAIIKFEPEEIKFMSAIERFSLMIETDFHAFVPKVISGVDVQSIEPVDVKMRDSLSKSVQLAIEIATK